MQKLDGRPKETLHPSYSSTHSFPPTVDWFNLVTPFAKRGKFPTRVAQVKLWVLFFQIANGQQISPRSFCWFTVFNEILVPWIGWIGAWNRCKGKIQDIKFISEGRSKELSNQTERISLAVRGYVKPLAEFCWYLLDVLTLIFWEYGPLTI